MSASRHQVAADAYELLVLSGMPKGVAFKAAMQTLRGDNAPVPLPAELPGLIESIVRSQVAEDWRAASREVRSGKSTHRHYVELRSVVAHVLSEKGYSDAVIGAALSRDRSSVNVMLNKFARRLAADQLLAARVERVLAAAGKARAA